MLGCTPEKEQPGTEQKQTPAPQAVVSDTAEKVAQSQPSPSDPLVLGKAVYEKQCAACHGLDGRGNGEAAYLLYPKPRDFVAARYRQVSTWERVPTDEDLFQTISRGMPGSAMPSWAHLPEEQRWALVRYIKSFAEKPFAVAPTKQPDSEGRGGMGVIHVPPEPPYTAEAQVRARELFADACASCHGVTGKGDGVQEQVDEEGFPTRPRDLTAGVFKGNPAPEHLYRDIIAGIPGTPMPMSDWAYGDDAWHLVHFVRAMSSDEQRERMEMRKFTIVAPPVNELPDHPDSGLWRQAQPVNLHLMPLWWRHERPEELTVRALHDGKELALLLVWQDATNDHTAMRPQDFRDAAAVQFALSQDPPFFAMGQKGAFVNIWMWKSERQADLEPAFQDLEKIYPNLGIDSYPNLARSPLEQGYTFHRVIYGPYRLRHPIVRKGWKAWVDAGFPELTPELKSKYLFDSRGQDEFIQISWEDAFHDMAKALVAISTRYSGEEGKKRLLAQGYQPEMVEAAKGAGTRCIKMRGGMGLLGVIGKYGMYRLNNSLALLDAKIRGVDHEHALAGRNWSNYTWHGDQAPGHPWVHGLQASDCDFNDLRFSKLIIMDGKNMVENKLTDSHWFIECMERGAKIVVITPEYGPPSTKADYWIPIRPTTDAALWLGITRLMIEKKWYDEEFVKRFTDFPLLVRTDTLKRLRAAEVFTDYKTSLSPDGPSLKIQGLTPEQHAKLGDFVIWDEKKNGPVAITRDDVGETMVKKEFDPALEGKFKITLVDGKEVEVATLWTLYQRHLKDYDLDTVCEITHAPRSLIEQLAEDIATMKPVAIHQGEGINHWFHATEMSRAAYLPLMLTGNIGQPGAGCHTWAGNYKAALFQGSPWTGPGFKGWVAEDPFEPNLDPTAHGKEVKAHAYTKDEEPAYWNHGDLALIVDTPKFGRRNFTGETHMPTPTKAILFNNVNLINNAKWAYGMIKNVNPNVEMIVAIDIQVTASVEYADLALPANSWLEFEGLEITASCSNPFLQIWKGGIPPVFDSRDDVMILAGIANALADVTGEQKFRDYFTFAAPEQRGVYIQRLLDTSTTTAGYKLDDIMAGKYGPPGGCLMNFRTYPRIPFYEQVHDNEPFFTDTGRLHAYADVPEAIEYGENFIVHREGPEATPYLPNVIVSSNPYIRPEDYGIPLKAEHWDERTIRNVKKPWAEVKKTKNFLWEKGFRFYCLTPKSRHRVHSGWANVDWHMLYDSNFGDPYRLDKRAPCVGEQQLHMNPQAARDLGINDGDYVYIDANPADRPYLDARPDDPFYRVSRCMLRVKYNHAYPYNCVMMKHAPYIATEKSVKAHETRPDGRALSENTGYQANLRYGSQQSFTRNWHMPMHQTDTLFHKAKASMSFIFGGEADNHAVNTVPKETLVRVTKAEDGGMGGKGIWTPATTGYTPDNENDFMKRYLEGDLVKVKG